MDLSWVTRRQITTGKVRKAPTNQHMLITLSIINESLALGWSHFVLTVLARLLATYCHDCVLDFALHCSFGTRSGFVALKF